MSVKIENGDGYINIRNDIGTVKFRDNGVFETVDSVGWIDDTTGKMTVFKRNKVYSLVFLRVDLTGGSKDGRISYKLGSAPIVDNSVSAPMQYAYMDEIYGDGMDRSLSKIPFAIKSIRVSVLKQNLPSSNGTTIPDLRSSLPPYEGSPALSYYELLQDNKEILNGTITTAPIVSVSVTADTSTQATLRPDGGISTSSHVPNTQDTINILMTNPGSGFFAYEFTMDFIYDN